MTLKKKRVRRKRRPGWEKAAGAMTVLIDENKRSFEVQEVRAHEFELTQLPDPPVDENVPIRREPEERAPIRRRPATKRRDG